MRNNFLNWKKEIIKNFKSERALYGFWNCCFLIMGSEYYELGITVENYYWICNEIC